MTDNELILAIIGGIAVLDAIAIWCIDKYLGPL